MKVEVEYCGAWGYGPKYRQLASTIIEAVPSAQCSGKVGRSSSFEVVVDGKLIYSKLQNGSFPCYSDIAKAVQALKNDETVPEIKEQEQGSCIIL